MTPLNIHGGNDLSPLQRVHSLLDSRFVFRRGSL